ncbi:MAG: S10 family peptidase [Spirochaetia bacterium]
MENDKNKQKPEKNGDYQKPKGAQSVHEMKSDERTFGYQASAEWIVLHKQEKPKAEMFFVSYTADVEEVRPLTFVFNGGPGASSVYLHMGALGPRRIQCKDNGQPLQPPYPLINNPESWLKFTDLVFIDPIGTGFSRMINEENGDKKDEKAEKKEQSEYWKVKRDLESLGEFLRRYLSKFHRWESPIYIAGESYGGFRAAKLAKMAQQDYGIGLNGVIIISPALEFTLLDGSDYDVLPWLDSFPSMAAAAKVHGRTKKSSEPEDLKSFRVKAVDFAVKELLPVLAVGDLCGADRKIRVLNGAADFLGLPRQVVQAKNGRVGIDYFVKNLLRDQGLQLGLYDAAISVQDPYPDRDSWTGPDPTLHQLERVFAAGINTHIRKTVGLETDREYDLLSNTVNKNWQVDTRKHALESQVGATDDLRYGMSLNPDMKVFLTHGIFDLVTPYFAVERIRHLMKLTEEQKQKMTVKYYYGGHMFYTREETRRQFYNDMLGFYRN